MNQFFCAAPSGTGSSPAAPATFKTSKSPNKHGRYWVFSRALSKPYRAAETLSLARLFIPEGFVNIHRMPEDHPTIAEVWT